MSKQIRVGDFVERFGCANAGHDDNGKKWTLRIGDVGRVLGVHVHEITIEAKGIPTSVFHSKEFFRVISRAEAKRKLESAIPEPTGKFKVNDLVVVTNNSVWGAVAMRVQEYNGKGDYHCVHPEHGHGSFAEHYLVLATDYYESKIQAFHTEIKLAQEKLEEVKTQHKYIGDRVVGVTFSLDELATILAVCGDAKNSDVDTAFSKNMNTANSKRVKRVDAFDLYTKIKNTFKDNLTNEG